MAKGDLLKKEITNKLEEVFGNAFLGVIDKKIYLQGKENGETIQIAITMTCPKTLVEVSNTVESDSRDFTQAELDSIARLSEKLKSL
jgi:SHS2 domain-containing protein